MTGMVGSDLKWKDGDTTIAIANVVDSFNIYFSTQGHQGLLGQQSKQQLDADFGTTKDDEIIHKILTEGKSQAGDGFNSPLGLNTTNVTRGSNVGHR